MIQTMATLLAQARPSHGGQISPAVEFVTDRNVHRLGNQTGLDARTLEIRAPVRADLGAHLGEKRHRQDAALALGT